MYKNIEDRSNKDGEYLIIHAETTSEFPKVRTLKTFSREINKDTADLKCRALGKDYYVIKR